MGNTCLKNRNNSGGGRGGVSADYRAALFAVMLQTKSNKPARSEKDQAAKNEEEKKAADSREDKSKDPAFKYKSGSRRMAVVREEERVPAGTSCPVEVGVAFRVPRSKIIVNPFYRMADRTSETRVVEIKMEALNTDLPVRNIVDELFTPKREPTPSGKKCL